MNKLLVALLLVVIVLAGGYVAYQYWLKAQPVADNQQNQNNNVAQNCVKEGEPITVDYIGTYGKIPDNVCCAGLTPIKDSATAKPLTEGGCSGVGSDSYACTACGNGVCGKGENQCNCPQDCKGYNGINISDVKNAQYGSMDYGNQPISLNNGVYNYDCGLLSEKCYTKIYDDQFIKFGDLNNDGVEEAVVILTNWGGGTGNFRSLFILQKKGAIA